MFFSLNEILKFFSSTWSKYPMNNPSEPPPVQPQNRATVRDICSLFCCPPFPSAIVSKLAFMPPEKSYKILNEDSDK